MGKIFGVEFQTYPLKFYTIYICVCVCVCVCAYMWERDIGLPYNLPVCHEHLKVSSYHVVLIYDTVRK